MNSRLALGTVQFGLAYGVANRAGKVGFSEAQAILREARSSGINTLDTAIAYGDSETLLGEIGSADWQIITKLPEVPDACIDVTGWVHEQIEGSLLRLGSRQLYAVLLHRPGQLLEEKGKELFSALQALKVRGYTKKIGISIYSPEDLDELLKTMDFDLVQAPLNILDQRIIKSGWSRRLRLRGVELHVRSAFLQGLLLMPPDQRPWKFARWQSLWDEWERWLTATELSPLQASLRYVLNITEVDKVVVGVDSVSQFREILAASVGQLPSLPEWPHPIDGALINPASWNQL
ncbi:aldo/keto reductase [Eoetvoesiella caeni]|uniref:NADP-dependent oxidoreductase domain-containing protein n=1 Tax=Eoetvoesiella caeni TaxID=645616 RepID=A0A366HHV8_9BURK|nr:aldo/keto reductase [Eoetvoesiella caeni]MCI2807805.1 aldo/keto reductase [Eoetvoesiella caeni]NYT54192.1 aldo/keto reductase [Eoetvoesiella caeni]RBP41721.1 hypothetical protein DFR37_102100 [Eoetvoesiella caeni]